MDDAFEVEGPMIEMSDSGVACPFIVERSKNRFVLGDNLAASKLIHQFL